jgi:lambda family phage portal protein
MKAKISAFDRFALALSPRWGLNRIRSRMAAEILARHYEAASGSRRTTGWPRSGADANSANGPALQTLRAHARDLDRNNAWARNSIRVVCDNTVGWGIRPKALGNESPNIAELWKRWGETTECDADGRLDFYGLQHLMLRTVVKSGEVLVRRRRRRAEDGLTIPLQLQVLEPDFLDATRDSPSSDSGGPIIQGVEFDKLGRRSAYWLFSQHPGSGLLGTTAASHPVPAEDVAHIYRIDRPGQVRGVSWLAAAIVNLKDFDEFEDASLMRAKIAACFVAFVTDVDASGSPLGQADAADPSVESFEPGMIKQLKPGQEVSFGTPPTLTDDGFSERTLRRISAAIGVTYEDLTGDYSQVNFSSARMARLAHWSHVNDWRWNMLVPQGCDVAWGWAMEAAMLAGLIESAPRAAWTPPPMPMLEPDKEGLALQRLVRVGAKTPDEMVREQGYDPDEHWAEYSASFKKLDQLGIVLDSDPRKTTQNGQVQQEAGSKPSNGAAAVAPPSDDGT